MSSVWSKKELIVTRRVECVKERVECDKERVECDK